MTFTVVWLVLLLSYLGLVYLVYSTDDPGRRISHENKNKPKGPPPLKLRKK